MHPNEVPTVRLDQLPDGALLLDVREDDEWEAGHIGGAVHVPMSRVPDHVQYAPEFSTDRPIVVLCKGGGRSARVTAWLCEHGYDAVNLDGGMLAWDAARCAMVSENGQPPAVV